MSVSLFDRALNQEWCNHTCKSEFDHKSETEIKCRVCTPVRSRLALQNKVSKNEPNVTSQPFGRSISMFADVK